MVEEKLGGDLQKLIREAVQKKEYSLNKKFYQGIVVANDDQEKIGRCRIRVYGVYGDDIPSDSLPWASADMNFVGSTVGSFVVPTVGTLVNVYFENDDLYLPRYTTKVIQKSSLTKMNAGIDRDYPNTMVFYETDAGDYFKINRKTHECTFRHCSGLVMRIDEDGNILLDNTNTDGGLEIKIAGDANIKAQGDIALRTGKGGAIKLLSEDGTTSLWKPNALPNCLFTGAPHSMDGLGINSLRGTE